MTAATISLKMRARRFVRGELKTNVQLVERDLDILALLHRHHFLRSTHIADLVAGSERKIIDRLGDLFRAGFVDRPRQQLEYFNPGSGSRPIAYALGNEGARALILAGRIADEGRLQWHRKNAEATRLFLRHQLAISDIAVALTLDVRERPGLKLLQLPELLPSMPQATRDSDTPLKWSVPVRVDGQSVTIGLVPDLAFGLAFPDDSRRCFLLEADRATMPVKRSGLDHSSVYRKLLAYEHGRHQRQHERQFNWRNFRTLIVTETRARVDNIRALIREHRLLAASPLFLITDKPALEAAPDILTHPWLTPAGAERTLIT